MAWIAPRTWAVNEVLTAANMNTYVSDNLAWLNTLRPRATAIGSLSVASGSFVTPTGTWSSCSPNVGGMYSSSAMYFTCATPGDWQFNLSVQFTTSPTGKRGAVICSDTAANGLGTIYAMDMREPVGNTEINALSLTTGLVRTTAINQRVHFAIRQSTGASMTCAVRFSGYFMGNP